MTKRRRKTLSIEDAEARAEMLARESATACAELRGSDVLLLDLRGICDYTDFFVIASANSQAQMKGISREVEKGMKRHHARQLARNGLESGHWVLLDYGDVVVHLFDESTRHFYELEELWGDAPRIPVTAQPPKEGESES